MRLSHRLALGVATTVTLLLASCGPGRRLVDGRGDDPEPVDDRPAGRLAARPRAPETATEGPTGVSTLALSGGASALLYVPVGHQGDRPSPLVVLFHGAGGTAEDGLGPLRQLADDAGTMLLAPQARGRTWDLLLEGYGPDSALLDEALTAVFARYVVDPAHLAVGGFSDGASYALSMGGRNGDLFSHVIAFSPGFRAPGDTQGSPSYFVTHGIDDQVLPIASTSRGLVPMLERAGYQVTYHEFAGGHVVPGDLAAEAMMWFLAEGD